MEKNPSLLVKMSQPITLEAIFLEELIYFREYIKSNSLEIVDDMSMFASVALPRTEHCGSAARLPRDRRRSPHVRRQCMAWFQQGF